ncbi:MAG TPA: thermonuclease family protein [Alphaproteobacteria bacterium]|nr:thermonuclease family protein [Alphaproteobacteria bacterium]
MRRLPLITAVLVMLLPGLARGQSAHQPYIPLVGFAQALEGDLLTVNGVLVRLYALDAPELGQFCSTRDGRPYDCGLAARNILTRLIADREVACTLYSRLPSGTEVGTCAVNNVDLGGVMVLSGWAFSDRALSNRYEPHEAQAQANQQGLWSGRAERPWVWRQEQIEAGFR